MKNFLAVDTSNEYLTVVACKDGVVESEFIENCSMRHSITLMNAIDNLLTKTGWTLSDFDFFSAVVGAGSFTGIRIGISAIKGFCLALNKPALPITSFDVSAYNSVRERGKKLCLVDALQSLASKEKFGELTALYVRKSSAELNLK